MVLEPLDNRKSYRRQFRLPIEDSREIERQITEMHHHVIIEPSENAEFNAPVFLVAKKSGTKWLVIDLHSINTLIRPQILALSKITELVEEIVMQQSAYLSSCDLFSGYYQIKIDKNSRKYCTFTSPLTGNRWAYRRAPFGLVNSPAI